MDDELVTVIKEQMQRINDLAETMDHRGTRRVLRQIANRLELVVMANRGVDVPLEVEDQS
jgi:hypothetical protein